MNVVYALKLVGTDVYVVDSLGNVIWYPVREFAEQQLHYWNGQKALSGNPRDAEIVEFIL